ncbi:MAG: glycosyltransferase family 2 protein [Nitrospinaceae bacterium]
MNILQRKKSQPVQYPKPVVSLAQEARIASISSRPPLPFPGTRKTLIVIPAFNEERNLGAVLEGIHLTTPGIPVLVVNDGSSDGTARVARDHQARVISLPFNSGYGVALQTGFMYAMKNNYSIVVQMDADGQHDPKHIIDLLQEIHKSDLDVVIGSRFLGQGKYRTSLPKHLGMFIFGQLASLFCHQKVTDPTSGFQALKGRAISFVAGDNYPPDFPDADFLIMLHRSGFKIREIPVTMRPSPDNKSMHHGHKTVYYVFKMLLSIIVTLLRQKPRG